MYPAGVRNVSARTVALESGLRLRVLEAGVAAGAPVVLVHGWGACVYTFRFVLEALARAGRHALAFDLRGHGLSDKPTGRHDYETRALIGDLRELMDRCGLERADLIGHSLGGGIALRFALDHPARVRRLVLVAPVGLTTVPLHMIAHLLTPRFTERLARYLPPRWVTAFLLRGAYGDGRRVTDRTIDEYWAPSQFEEYYVAVRRLLERFGWQPLPPRELAKVRQRTLVMLGGADRLIRGGEGAANLIPDVSVVSLHGAGHLGIEECPDEFNEVIVRFLNDEEISVATSAAMG
jgi:4,5:9,10-diseco-3-hydroxy-5,9,17-trioxoandrosta-1(10),2-diene-4-oate hydrolase